MFWTVVWAVKWAALLSISVVLMWLIVEIVRKPRGWLSKLSALTGWKFESLERDRWQFFQHSATEPSDTLIVSFAGAALLVGGYAQAVSLPFVPSSLHQRGSTACRSSERRCRGLPAISCSSSILLRF